MRRAVSALVLALLAAGCEVVPSPLEVPFAPRLQLYSLLQADTDTVSVLIERNGTVEGRLQTLPVSGARVRISGPRGEAQLVEASPGFPDCVTRPGSYDPGQPPPVEEGCYAAVLPGGVRAGETYSLSVNLPDGGTVAGRTTVPLPPEPIHPVDETRVPMRRYSTGDGGVSERVTLRWRAPSAGSQVALHMRQGALYERGKVVTDANCYVSLVREDSRTGLDGRLRATPGDSVQVRGQLNGCYQGDGAQQRQVRLDSLEVHLRLIAVDPAYAGYLERGDAVRETRASAGIEGAFGVFGSASSVQRRLLFVFPDA